MSRSSTGSKRRELLMLWIRKSVKGGGMPVNRCGFRHTKYDKDLKALFKKGLIKQVREDRSFRGQFSSNSKLTRILPSDGVGYDGEIVCPDCGNNLDNTRNNIRSHAVNCALRTDHKLDVGSTLRREQLKHRN